MDHFHTSDTRFLEGASLSTEEHRLECRLLSLEKACCFSEVIDWIDHLIRFSLDDIDVKRVCDCLTLKIANIILPFIKQLKDNFLIDEIKSSIDKISRNSQSFRFCLDCIMYDRIVVNWNKGLFIDYTNDGLGVEKMIPGGDGVGEQEKELILESSSVLKTIRQKKEELREYNKEGSLIFQVLDFNFSYEKNKTQSDRAQSVIKYTQKVIRDHLKIKNGGPELTEGERSELVQYYILNLGKMMNWLDMDIHLELWKLWPDKYKAEMTHMHSPDITMDNYSTWLEYFSTYSNLSYSDCTIPFVNWKSAMSILSRRLVVRSRIDTPARSRLWVEKLCRLPASAKFFEEYISFCDVLNEYRTLMRSSTNFGLLYNVKKSRYTILESIVEIEKICDTLKQSYDFLYRFVYVEMMNYLYGIDIVYSLTDEGLGFLNDFLGKYDVFFKLHKVLELLIIDYKSSKKARASIGESDNSDLQDEIQKSASMESEAKSSNQKDRFPFDKSTKRGRPSSFSGHSESPFSKMEIMNSDDFEACRPWFEGVSHFLSRGEIWSSYFSHYNGRNACNFSIKTEGERQVFTDFQFCLGYNIDSANSDQIDASVITLTDRSIPDVTIHMNFSQEKFDIHVIFWRCNLVFEIDSVSFFLTGPKGKTYDLKNQSVRSGTFFADLGRNRENSEMYFRRIINSTRRDSHLSIRMQSREDLVSVFPNKVGLYLLFDSLNKNSGKIKNRFCITLRPTFTYLTPWKSIEGLRQSGDHITKLCNLITSRPTTKELLHASYASDLSIKLELLSRFFAYESKIGKILESFSVIPEDAGVKLIMFIARTLEKNKIFRTSLNSICPDIDDSSVPPTIISPSTQKGGKRAKSRTS